MIDPKDIIVSGVDDKPQKGMWHNGPNNHWLTITHKPTQASVRIYGRKTQYRTREVGLMALELILEETGYEPCLFPERVAPMGEQG
jgi:hypothetical protein